MSTFTASKSGLALVTALLLALSMLPADARLVRGTAGTSLDNQGDEISYFITPTVTAHPEVIFSENQFWLSGFAVSPVPVFDETEGSCVGPDGDIDCGYTVEDGQSLRLEVFPAQTGGMAVLFPFPSDVQVAPRLDVTWRVYSASNGELLKTEVFEDQSPSGPYAFELVLNGLPSTDPDDLTDFHRLEVEFVYSLPEDFAFYSGRGLLFEADIRYADSGFANLGAVLTGKSSTFLRIHPDAVPADITPPVSSAAVTPAPNASGWNNSAVTVTITATDEPDGSGLELIRYEFGAEPTLSMGSSPSSPTSFVIAGPGVIPVTYSAVDREGNEETPRNLTVNIDLTNPLIAASVAPAANAAGWHRGSVTVGFVCTDALSGIASCLPGQQILSAEGEGQSATGVATDNAGNMATTVVSAINIDLTAPTINAIATPSPNPAGWNNTPVTVSFECADALSGVASCSADNVLSSDGSAQSAAGSATDRAGNTASATAGGINIDRTPPQVVVTGITADAVYLPGEAPAAECETTDALSGVATDAVLTLSGRDDGVGSFTATCDGARDTAGNAAAAVSVSYDVRYPFTGFFRPVDNLPVVNRARAGQAVPLRFSLGGDFGLGILAAGSPYTQAVGCTTAAFVSDVEETVSAGNSSLSYDPSSGEYIYVWKTARAFANSCRRLTIALIDGTNHSAHFEFR